ncbi:glycosyltransferase family 2 protein [Erwinia sp. CGal63]|uniref:glycosyltransferase family 2 protein n=1 Tax=Erwinia sp. CGal63 TaxID=2919889 RepID=UPI00300A5D27
MTGRKPGCRAADFPRQPQRLTEQKRFVSLFNGKEQRRCNMINGKRTGVGIVTYNRKAGLMKLYHSLPRDIIDALIVVNDGAYYPELGELECHLHHNEVNQGVGRSKNIALRYLQSQDVDHFFLIEDDIFVKDPSVFARYIELSMRTGIQHFNFSQHGDKNMLPDGTPNPCFTMDYGDFTMPLFPACVGAFCYYSKKCLDKVGLMDEVYYNAAEHLDHTYAVIKAGFHPSYHYFPDIENAGSYLGDEGWSPQQSTISGKLSSRAIGLVAVTHFQEKHGCPPTKLPRIGTDALKKELLTLRKRAGSRALA